MSTALQNSDALKSGQQEQLRLPSEKQFKRSPVKLVLEIAVLSVAVISVVELFLALANAGQQEYLQPDAVLGMVHIPKKQVTWRMEGFSNDKFNSQGERDIEHAFAKPRGVKRIAFLGDSATEGLQVPLEKTYARRLQSLLDEKYPGQFEVLNFACASYSTGQQLVKMRDTVAKYRPDLTVYLYNRHDACDSVRDPSKKFVDPRPYFYLDQKKILHQDDSILKVEAPRLAPNAVLDFLRRNSRIYGVMMQTDLYLGVNESLYRILRSGLKAGIPAHPKPRYESQMAFFVMLELIKSINEECRNGNGQFAVMMFPKTIEDPQFATQGAYISDQARKDGFHYLDLSQSFENVPNKNRLFLQVHFSEDGHEIVARKLFESLTSNWNFVGREVGKEQ